MLPKLPTEMPWQIYQAYLQGPNALLGLFEHVSFAKIPSS